MLARLHSQRVLTAEDHVTPSFEYYYKQGELRCPPSISANASAARLANAVRKVAPATARGIQPSATVRACAAQEGDSRITRVPD